MSVTIPCWFLEDHELRAMLERAQNVMTNLAGEQDTTALAAMIPPLRAELERRGQPYELPRD